MNLIAQRMSEGFAATFGSQPGVIVRAPGRVNIIGDHTDYLGGFCLPMAINLALYIAAGKSECGAAPAGMTPAHSAHPDSHSVIAASSLYEEHIPEEVSADRPGKFPIIAAILYLLRDRGIALEPGTCLYISGDLPAGAGLSSSAALAMGAISALDALFALALSRDDMIDIAISAEHRAGAPCGWMDPAVIAHASAGCALSLDCFHREFDPVALAVIAEMGYGFVAIHSGVVRSVGDGRYAALRAKMEGAAAALMEMDERITHPRVLGLESYVRAREAIPTEHAPYLDHYFLENERVKTFRIALENRNVWQAGNILLDSHESLRALGTGTPETDWLVERLAEDRACLGARVTGAGFGGCVIAILGLDARESGDGGKGGEVGPHGTLDALCAEGRAKFGREMRWWNVEPGDGVLVSDIPVANPV